MEVRPRDRGDGCRPQTGCLAGGNEEQTAREIRWSTSGIQAEYKRNISETQRNTSETPAPARYHPRTPAPHSPRSRGSKVNFPGWLRPSATLRRGCGRRRLAADIRASSVTRSFASRRVISIRCAPPYLLGGDVMRGGGRGDLRQMRDAEHLPLLRDLPHLLAHRIGGLAADVRIHLVEHQHGDLVLGREHGLERQHDARQFAEGGDGAQRAGGLAGVGGELEFDVSRPCCVLRIGAA